MLSPARVASYVEAYVKNLRHEPLLWDVVGSAAYWDALIACAPDDREVTREKRRATAKKGWEALRRKRLAIATIGVLEG